MNQEGECNHKSPTDIKKEEIFFDSIYLLNFFNVAILWPKVNSPATEMCKVNLK